MATYHTPAVNFQASYVENLHDTAKMLIFAALLCRPPAPIAGLAHIKSCSDGGMVDTKDLKSFGHCGCAGSSPAPSPKQSLAIW